jgi:hypothetical protein
MKPDQAAMRSTCPARLNRLSPAETLAGRSTIVPVMAQYCGGGNIASAAWRGHQGESTAARRRGNSESMIPSAATSFPDFCVTERCAAAKLKIARAI